MERTREEQIRRASWRVTTLAKDMTAAALTSAVASGAIKIPLPELEKILTVAGASIEEAHSRGSKEIIAAATSPVGEAKRRGR